MLQVVKNEDENLTPKRRKFRPVKTDAGMKKAFAQREVKKVRKRRKPGVQKVYHFRITCWNFQTTAANPREALRKFGRMVARTKVTKKSGHLTWMGYAHRGTQAAIPYPPPPTPDWKIQQVRLWYVKHEYTGRKSAIVKGGPPEIIRVALPPNVQKPHNLNMYPAHRQVDEHRFVGGWEVLDFPAGTLIQKGDSWKKLRPADLYLPWADQD